MPELGEFNTFSDVQAVTDAIKEEVSWAEGKQIETYEPKIGLHEHINQNKLDPYLLLEALEDAKDAWDENGNLVKIADYRDPINGGSEMALEGIFQIRQVIYQKELEKAYQAVEKAEQKSGHLFSLNKGESLVLGSDPDPILGSVGSANRLEQIIETKGPKVLPAAAIELSFSQTGRLSLRTLSSENQVTVCYKSKTDEGLHFLPLPQEVDGAPSREQLDEFNEDAAPGNTKIFVYDKNGYGVVFSEYTVVLGKNFKEFVAGQPANIKEIRWRWQEVKPNEPQFSIEDIVIKGEEPPAGVDERIFYEAQKEGQAETVEVKANKYYKVGKESVPSLPYENAFGLKLNIDGTVSLMAGQEDCYGLVFYKKFGGHPRYEPAFSLENRLSSPERIKTFRQRQAEMNREGDLRTLRIELFKDRKTPTHQITFSDFPEYYENLRVTGQLTMKIEKIKP